MKSNPSTTPGTPLAPPTIPVSPVIAYLPNLQRAHDSEPDRQQLRRAQQTRGANRTPVPSMAYTSPTLPPDGTPERAHAVLGEWERMYADYAQRQREPLPPGIVPRNDRGPSWT